MGTNIGNGTGQIGISGGRILLDVIRPEDLVALTLSLFNLQRTASNQIAAIDASQPCYIVVDLPPQVVAEGAGFTASNDNSATQAPSKIAGPSRLAFAFDAPFAPVDYTLAAVLALCSKGAMVVPASAVAPPIALPPPAADTLGAVANGPIDRALAAQDPAAGLRLLAKIAPPTATGPGNTGVYPANAGSAALGDKNVTWLEIPHRLLLAPNPYAAWGHAGAAVTSPSTGRVELWHSYLGVRDPVTGQIDERNGAYRTVSAVGTRDDDAPNKTAADARIGEFGTNVFTSIRPDQRRKIVSLTNGPQGTPVALKRLMLSALGGYVDGHGQFTDPRLASWTERLAQGREHFVEITSEGYLFPFGQPATLQQIAQRCDDPNRQVGLLERFNVVIIRKPITSYRDGDVSPKARQALLGFPFAAVAARQTTFVCKPLIDPMTQQNANSGFLYDLSGNLILAPFVGYDKRGRPIKFEVPLFYVDGPPELSTPSANCSRYGAVSVALNGQRVAFAPSSRDDTTYETASFMLSLSSIAPPDAVFDVVPQASSLDIEVEAMRQLVGQGRAVVDYDPIYALHGFRVEDNRGERLFALVTPPSVSADFGNNGGGKTGFAAPNMTYTGISRKSGPVAPDRPGGSAQRTIAASSASAAPMDVPAPPAGLDRGGFDPAQFLDQTLGNTKLFGVVPLLGLIQAVDPGAMEELDAFASTVNDGLRYAPKFITETYHEIEHVLATLLDIKDKVAMLWEHADDLRGIALHAASDRLSLFEAANRNRVVAYSQAAQAALANLQTAARALVNAAAKCAKDIETGDVLALTGIAPAPQAPAATSDAQVLLAAITGVENALLAFGSLPPVPPQVTQIMGTVFAPISAICDGVTTALETARGYVTRAADLAQKLVQVGQGIDGIRQMQVKLEWRPKLQVVNVENVAYFVPANQHGLVLSVDVRPKANGNASAGADVLCRMDRFTICLGPDRDNPVLALAFDHFQFKTGAGKKPDVDVVLQGIHFGGPLAFVETLRNLIPLDGFSDPPHLDVTDTGIDAGFTIAVPNVAIGMFSLENIAVSAQLTVPFIGSDPLTFSFAFSDRDHPFLVTVSMLGGGGYFKLVATPRGIQSIEAAIYAAASLALDLIVASGSVSVAIGISFLLAVDDGGATHITLGGYLRLHGQLEVLGLITISVDLRLELTYTDPGGCLVARATLHVAVDVAFFSTSVDIPFERRFAGSNGDPTLTQLLDPWVDASPWWDTRSAAELAAAHATRGQVVPWADYCNAFA